MIRRYRIDGEHRLPFVPTGDPPHHVTSLLGTNTYREALTKITADSDLTIIDCGPILTVSDAGAVAGLVDGILLVVDAATPPEQLLRVRERLRPISTPLLGYVLNRVSDAGAPAYRYETSA